MPILVVTIPGMGKTTYVKNKFAGQPVEERRCVDFDYKCPFVDFPKEVKYLNSKTMSEWLESGAADMVLTNVDWVSLGAINNEKVEVVFVHPQDVESVKKRLIERDGADNDIVSSRIDAMAEQLVKAEREFGNRFKSRSFTMETLENLDEQIATEVTDDGTGENAEPTSEGSNDTPNPETAEDHQAEAESTDNEDPAREPETGELDESKPESNEGVPPEATENSETDDESENKDKEKWKHDT